MKNKVLIKNTTVYVGENFDRFDDVDILIEKAREISERY